MTRLLLLTSTGNQAPPVDPPPDPDGPQTEWPDPLDANVTTMRPIIDALATLTVDTAFAESATNFHTIGEALTEATDLQSAAVQQTSLSPGEFSVLGSPYGPDYRVDVIVAAGDYDEGFGIGGWVCLVGATGDPADVVIHTDSTGSGVIHSFGAVYLENLTIRSEGVGSVPSGPKYPWHITNSHGASIAANCVFEEPNTGGEGSAGMDGGSGTTCLFYKCDLASGTNLHGEVGADLPVTTMFIDCTLTEDVGYSQSGDVFDEFWFIGNTGASFTTSGDVNEHTSGTWPVPEEWLSEEDQAYYLPSSVRTPHTQTLGTADQAAFSPPAGRIYYIPLPLTAAIHRTHHGVVAASAGGVVGVRTGRQATPPGGNAAATQNLGTLVSGANEVQFYYYDTFYPGESDHVWATVAIISGTPSLQGSLALAADAYYSDNDGATVLAVPGGSRVPVVRVRSAS